MKVTIISSLTLILLLSSFTFGLPHHSKNRADVIDETNLPDGDYTVQSSFCGFGCPVLGAFQQGDGNIETWLGQASVEDPNFNADNMTVQNALKWRVIKDDFPYEGAIYLNRHILTLGPNRFNNFDFELPAGNGSFPVNKLWRLRKWTEVTVAINNVNFFDFGHDDNTCAQHNGLFNPVTFEVCDDNNLRQHWEFIPLSTK